MPIRLSYRRRLAPKGYNRLVQTVLTEHRRPHRCELGFVNETVSIRIKLADEILSDFFLETGGCHDGGDQLLLG